MESRYGTNTFFFPLEISANACMPQTNINSATSRSPTKFDDGRQVARIFLSGRRNGRMLAGARYSIVKQLRVGSVM